MRPFASPSPGGEGWDEGEFYPTQFLTTVLRLPSMPLSKTKKEKPG
jgi:hypothetical protein